MMTRRTNEQTYRKAAASLRRTARDTSPEYVLVKADGTRSARNSYDAISRIAGFYPGSKIERA